jgi:2-C-methyl-D-erythritol 4-phosphate cytidylyltransferase
MVEWSIDAFAACESVRRVVVAAPPGHNHALVEGAELAVVAGGATRAESVANALAVVETELVAIHDAARPLLRPALVEGLLADLEADPAAAGVIAAAPLADTLKRAAESRLTLSSNETGNVSLAIEETVDREGLWVAQTPQVFRTRALREALAVEPERREGATDEAMLVEAAGGTVLLRHCREPNFKVTTAADLRLAELALGDRA